MNIKTVVVGELSTNCYILENGGYCLVIDPGAEAQKIINAIDKRVVGIVITHSHDDHIGALADLVKKYNVRVYSMNNLHEGMNSVDNFTFEVIYTPGHKEDAITLYFKEDNMMFVGDFIFYHSIGRTDLAGGSPFDMKNSIKKILEYPHDVKIYPGHYIETTLSEEEPYLDYFKNTI